MIGLIPKQAIRSAYDAGFRDGQKRTQMDANLRAWPIIISFARERQTAYQRTYFGLAALLSGLLVVVFAVLSMVQPNVGEQVIGAAIVVMLLGLSAMVFGHVYRNKEDRLRHERIEAHEERWREQIEFIPDLGVMRMDLKAAEMPKSNGEEPEA